MKITSFLGEVWLRYMLQDSELERATSDVAAIYKNAQQRSNWPTEEIAKTERSLRIYRAGKEGSTKVGDIHHSVTVKTYRYDAEVKYAKPLMLSQKLVDFELNCLRISDLSLERSGFGPSSQLFVCPAELEYLLRPWSLFNTWLVVKSESDTKPYYTMTITIPGNIKNQEQTAELQTLCDTLYLPINNGDGTWTSPNPHGSETSEMPEITLHKRFYGEFSSNAEQRLKELYETVKEFVLRHKITEDFGLETKGYSWADTVRQAYRETEQVGALGMAEYISVSTLERQVMWYAPMAQVCLSLPGEKVYPRYTYLGSDNYGIADVVDVLEVNACPESVEPSLVVVNNYVWPGRK